MISGLAVSGGLDSMALAYLCRSLPMQRPRFKAFIVDHRAREGSRREAEAVRDALEGMGTKSVAL